MIHGPSASNSSVLLKMPWSNTSTSRPISPLRPALSVHQGSASVSAASSTYGLSSTVGPATP